MDTKEQDIKTTGSGARAVRTLVVALAGIVANFVLAYSNSSMWSGDFGEFYGAGKLAGTGHLYDWPALRALETQQGGGMLPYLRFPFVAFAFKPLSAMPFGIARALWLAIGIAALIGFVALWPSARRQWTIAAICWSAPIAMCLAYGQDTVLFLFLAALGLRLLMGGRDFWAGLVLSVCAAKPHLALLLPIFLVAQQKWRALSGAIAGGVSLLLVSFAVEGAQWPARLLSVLALPESDLGLIRMPNMRGLLSIFGDNRSAEIALLLVGIASVFWLCRRLPLRSAMTVALSGGLLLGHHGYLYDALLLIPALWLPLEESYPEWLGLWALVLFTPLPYLLLLTDLHLLGHLAVSGYTVALLVVMGRRTFRPDNLHQTFTTQYSIATGVPKIIPG